MRLVSTETRTEFILICALICKINDVGWGRLSGDDPRTPDMSSYCVIRGSITDRISSSRFDNLWIADEG